jgi:X-Pro dipeptidyl-peptidase (S15 family)
MSSRFAALVYHSSEPRSPQCGRDEASASRRPASTVASAVSRKEVPKDRAPVALGRVDERAEQFMVPMRDGVRLATDVYLPAGARTRAAVLVRLPYDKSARFSSCLRSRLGSWSADTPSSRRTSAARRGARASSRPSRTRSRTAPTPSTGSPTRPGPAEPSACSAIPITASPSGPPRRGHPALRAIVPRVTTTSLADGWIYHQGVFCLYAMAEWGATAWVDRFLYDDVPDWTVRPLRDLVPSIRGGRRSASLDLWAATAPADRFWDRGVFGGGGPMPSRVRIPVLHSGGWWDVFQRAQVGDFLAMRRAGAGDQHLVMASTDHFDDELVPDGASVAYIEVDDEALEGFLPHSRAGARLLRPTPPGSGRPSSSDRPVAPRQRRMAPRRGMAPGCPSPRAVRRRCGVRRRRTRGRGRLGGPRPIGRRDDVDPRSGRISWPARST